MTRGPFRYAMPVRFADVDHAGIVYYPVYYHYFHVTFEEFFRQRMGAKSYVELLDEAHIGFPAVRSECDYRAPLRFGDTVEVEMTVEHLGEKSVRFLYRARRAADGATEAILAAEGRITCAVTDLQRFRAVAIPDDLRALFLELR